MTARAAGPTAWEVAGRSTRSASRQSSTPRTFARFKRGRTRLIHAPAIHCKSAYFGTYEVDEKEGVVRHYVQPSLWPEEVGRLYTRSIELSDDRLRLTTPPFLSAGEQRANRLTFERVK